MPFYDLHCVNCDKEFNIMASMADKTARNIPCPDCGSKEMNTVYKSAPFYVKRAGDTMPECANRNVCGSGCPHLIH